MGTLARQDAGDVPDSLEIAAELQDARILTLNAEMCHGETPRGKPGGDRKAPGGWAPAH
jgi:hypothetical protein